MWSITFVWCLLLISSSIALPTSKSDNELDVQKPESIIAVDVIEMQSKDEKPTDNSKPNEMAVDPKPIDVKPTEQTKPNESSSSPSSGSTSTILETIPLSVGPPRRQFLYDQRQDGKYNIRADLENFVILVVPSTGNSLLDLLKRSGQRQPQHHVKRTHNTKHHKKYHSSVSGGKTIEVKKASNRLDYLNRPEGDESAPVAGEFIEGRTPYHVDIQSDEILQPAAYAPSGVRSMNGAATIADLPLMNFEDNTASTSSSSSSSDASDATIILSTVTGKKNDKTTMLSNNDTSFPRLSKSIIIGGYGKNPFTNLNTVLLTPKPSNANDQQQQQHQYNENNLIDKNYNNYFSRKHSVQIVDKNQNSNEYDDTRANLINSSSSTELFDLTDSKNSFNSLNVGNIDRLALAGDSTTKIDADLANAQWELTLLGAEEQCGPDRRRDSYGVCQFVPADYATT